MFKKNKCDLGIKKDNSIMIEVKNLTFSYNDDIILKNINFNIKKGDLIAIVGPNGAGKSTLVKLLVSLIGDSKSKNSIKIHGKIAYIPQKFNQDSNFPAKVSELLELECCICNHSLNILKSLSILDLKEKQFKDLSGGQQQRVLLALALLSNPDILILDEPTVGIDSKTQNSFYDILKELNEKQGLTILFVTHDTSMISNYFKSILCVFDKNIIYDDANKSHEILHMAYGCNFHEIQHKHLDFVDISGNVKKLKKRYQKENKGVKR